MSMRKGIIKIHNPKAGENDTKKEMRQMESKQQDSKFKSNYVCYHIECDQPKEMLEIFILDYNAKTN